MSPDVRALIPTGFGINCEAETAHAFRLAGAAPQQVHLNDLIDRPDLLARCHVLALAGGFSFGDHLGAGKVFANRLRRKLEQTLTRFIADGGLVLGICNGFQTMVRLGLVPGGNVGEQTVGLAPNRHGCFHDGWVTLGIDPDSPCVFTRGMETLAVPVRHGEGRLRAPDPALKQIVQDHLAAVRYVDPSSGQRTQQFPANPNGSDDCIAGLCDRSGRLFGLMPHPEAFLHPENHPEAFLHPENHPGWRRRPLDDHGGGLRIFENAVAAARSG